MKSCRACSQSIGRAVGDLCLKCSGSEFHGDEHAGSLRHGMQAAPWQGRRPISPRTLRPAAQASCEAEYRQSFDSVPVRKGGWSGGFYDFDRDAVEGPRKGPPRPPRLDAEAMAVFVAKFSATLTAHELDVYALFWGKHMSYQEVGAEIGTDKNRVYECIKRLRIKRARAVGSAESDDQWRRR